MKKKLVLLLFLVVALCVSVPIVIFAASEKPVAREYALQYSKYSLSGNVVSVTFDGKDVRVINNSITLTKEGTYVIEYENKKVNLMVYETIPESEVAFDSEMIYEIGAYERFIVPSAEITDFLGNEITSYRVEFVDADGNTAYTLPSGVTGTYLFETTGNCKINYVYDSVFKVEDVISYDVNVVDKKVVVYPEVLDIDTLYIGDVLSTEDFFGYYQGNRYPAEIYVDNAKIYEDYTFTAMKKSSIRITSDILGERVSKTYSFDIDINYQRFFETDKCNGVSSSRVPFTTRKDFNAVVRADLGVDVVAAESGATVTYKGIVDLTKLNSTQNIIEFFVKSSADACMDYVNVKLTDIFDANNWLLVKWANCTAGGVAKTAGYHSYVSVQSSTGIATYATGFAAYTSNFYHMYKNIGHAFQIQFDYSNKILKTYNDNYNRQGDVADLDDPTVFGDKVWNGFTDGRCYIQIEMISVSGKDAGVIIGQIGGKNMNQLYSDTESFNTIRIDTDPDYFGNFPKGVVNYPYNIPQPFTTDILRGSYDVAVRLTDPTGVDVTGDITDGTFVPHKAGHYTVKYVAKDIFGRDIEKTETISILSEYPTITIKGVSSADPQIMSWWKVPEFNVTGGCGKLDITYDLEIDGEKVEPNDAGYVYVNSVCEIKFSVKATDYLGVSEEETTFYGVTYDGVYMGISGVPQYLKSGQVIDVPRFFSFNGNADKSSDGYNLSCKTYINGVDYTGKDSYTVDNLSEEVIFRFVADEGGENETEEIRSVAVGEVATKNDMSGYFDYGTATAVNADNRIEFTFNTQTSIVFKNPVAVDDLILKFGFTGSVVGTINSFRVKMEDYFDSSSQLYFDFYKYNENDTYSILRSAGANDAYIPGSLSGIPYSFVYCNNTMRIQSSGGTVYLNVSKDVNGNEFEGFKSGLIRLSFEFDQVSGSMGFAIEQIGNQTFKKASYVRGDRVGPMLLFKKDVFVYEEYSINTKYKVLDCVGYDVLQGRSDVFFKIVSPSGVILKNGEKVKDLDEISLDEYGNYVVRYYSQDALGNESYKDIVVRVLDEIAPQIVVSGNNLKDAYKVGDKIRIPTATFTDNTDGYTSLIYVLTPTGSYEFTAGGSEYQFKVKGTYYVVYSVKDADYNVSRERIKVVVK